MKIRGTETEGTSTVKSDEIEWKDTETAPYGEYTTTYKGNVKGDTMSGLVERGRNTFEWKATRKPNPKSSSFQAI